MRNTVHDACEYSHNLVEVYGWQSALGFIGYFGIFWSIVIMLFLKYSANPNIGDTNKVNKSYLSFGESLKRHRQVN